MRFRAVESVLPSQVVDNAEVLERVARESRANLSPADLERALRMLRFAFRSMGTRVRHRRAPGERSHELCAEAGRRALRSAEMAPEEIDLLVYVGVGRGFLEPATANVFQDVLALGGATCFDILDACASWLRAVHVAHAFFETGSYRNVMILNAEFNANYECYELRSLDEFDARFPTFTIGEAATATILSGDDLSDDDPGAGTAGADSDFAAAFRSFGDQRSRCIIPLQNWEDYLAASPEDLERGVPLEPFRFVSYGRDIMEFGLARLVEQFHKDPAFREYDPEIVFFHAASDGMARDGMRQCGLDAELGYYTHGRFANTVSASVPLAMSAAAREGRLEPGMRVMLAVASAGISTALARFVFRR